MLIWCLDNTFTDDHVKSLFRASTIFDSQYYKDAKLGNYGMNYFNLLLEHFTIPINNAVSVFNDQLMTNSPLHTVPYTHITHT